MENKFVFHDESLEPYDMAPGTLHYVSPIEDKQLSFDLEVPRSEHWPSFRGHFLVGKVCAVCGGTTRLQAHHIKPYHIHPELELSEGNLIALCEGNPNVNCHLFFGHLGNYKGWNPVVKRDALVFQAKIKYNQRRIHKTK